MNEMIVFAHIKVLFSGWPLFICSINNAPIRRTTDSTFGKIRITRSLRLISSLSLSMLLIVPSLFRYFKGKFMTAMTSSKPNSMTAMAFETLFSNSLIIRYTGKLYFLMLFILIFENIIETREKSGMVTD